MGQRNSTLQFQQCLAHGQLSGLATSGQPGALQAGLGHGDASPLATGAVSGLLIAWLPRREDTRFWITSCISSSPRRDGTQRPGGLGADAAALVRPAVVVHARRGPCELGDGRKPSASDHAQRRWRHVFRGPLGTATPARVLLAGHRCLAGAAQAWKMSVAHGSALVPESRSPGRGVRCSIAGRLFRR